MRASIIWLPGLLTLVSGTHTKQGWTAQHEAGRCAIRGNCGKQGFFGSELPCPDNGRAQDPTDDVRKQLVDLCGDKWNDGPVCCEAPQIKALATNLKRAESIITACPACKENFFNLFCTFTCSPDQSLFVNVTAIEPKGDKYLVTELDHLVSDDFGSAFYDSCKDVKFGPTADKAMKLIGGGAENYTEFLKFLGDKKPFGSPFQINFPRPDSTDFPDMEPQLHDAYPCDGTKGYKCACVDCAASCTELADVPESRSCHVGPLPCLSFAVIIIYSTFIALLVSVVTGHIAYTRHNKNRSERMRLLQDNAQSDDDGDDADMVRHAGMLEKPQRNYRVNTLCDQAFRQLGLFCAQFPGVTVGTSVLIVTLLSLGWLNFSLETDPVKLWVSPDSKAAKEKQFFDDSFGPFYRTEQIFLVNDTQSTGSGPVLSYDTLTWWFDVESRIRRMKSMVGGYTLDDVCFKPTGDACVVQSVSAYFGGPNGGVPDNWAEVIEDCAARPVDCLPDFGQPVEPKYVVGPHPQGALTTEALITTFVINNHQSETKGLKRAETWERALKDVLLIIKGEAKERGLRISFNTEISLEEELNKSTNTDAKIVVISYMIMFLYASIALGATTLTVRSILHNPMVALVQSKFMLGVIGIIMVLMSVSASVGLFAAIGVKATLIIAEVIPFLVLAVGVDNIFLIVHEFERVNVSHAEDSVEVRVSKALGRMGPSILLSAITETVAFALGAIVGMPAVRNFAAYAAGAVFINAILQVTMFVSVLTWNQQRVEAGRADCVPCLRVAKPDSINHDLVHGLDDEGVLQRFIRKTYAPALLGRKAKIIVMTVFFGILAASLALVPTVQLGLDQRVAIPSDSYLIRYFDDLYDYFEAGPPVYFVTKDVNATARSHQWELCGRFPECATNSLANVLEQERKRPNISYIADSTANWVDDFMFWLNPALPCCIDQTSGRPCMEDRWNIELQGMPEGAELVEYLQQWLQAPTTEDCPIAGKAPYGHALVVNKDKTSVPASHFRTAHTPLHSQSDFIDAYVSARRIADDISRSQGIEVFPYSKFYIFFDQYVDIVRLTAGLLGGALGFILVLTSFLLGSIATGLVVTITVAMILAAILGTMAMAHVSLNAVSLVNLVISVGIGVEFCAHIARAFTVPAPAILERTHMRGKDARAFAALVNVGGSVFSGITVTKLLGVSVLAFTRSKIFEVYYFRIWLALVVWAALHALVFLPVALSMFGGQGMSCGEAIPDRRCADQ